MANGDPIIIKGLESIEITLHKNSFPANDPGKPERHFTTDRKITKVELKDENTGAITNWPVPANGKCTIKIHHEKHKPGT